MAGITSGKYVTMTKIERENRIAIPEKTLRSILDFLFILIKLADVIPIAPMSLAINQKVVALFEVVFSIKK
jgi:hypothetical protein